MQLVGNTASNTPVKLSLSAALLRRTASPPSLVSWGTARRKGGRDGRWRQKWVDASVGKDGKEARMVDGGRKSGWMQV